MDGAVEAWVDGELAGCSLADDRLNKRLRKLLAQIGSAMGQSIPLVCQDWANAKAAYRFFDNDRVSEADIDGQPVPRRRQFSEMPNHIRSKEVGRAIIPVEVGRREAWPTPPYHMSS